MEDDNAGDMEVEILSSMWHEDIDAAGKKFNVEKPGADQDLLEDLTFTEEPTIVDFERLRELTSYSEKGSSQLSYLVKNWEWKQENAVRLLREELENLRKQQGKFELKKLEILKEHQFKDDNYGGDKLPVSILDEVYEIFQDAPKRRTDVIVQDERLEIEDEYDANTVKYWKERALHLEKLLNTSMQWEQILLEKLEESIEKLEKQSSPVEELSKILKRADNFLHFVLQNAPVVIGHQDKELRYRFIYNHFPSLSEEDVIGKKDVEIFKGGGVKEFLDFKREVLEKRLPRKREITFETELFGAKTFLIYVEPVFSKAGETIGVNYVGMEITDQVRKREKMAMLREEIAVQKARETELNKTIHITEETMIAKQMLATMSHEIRSPLSWIISMGEMLTTTKLDKDQKQLLSVMLSSGDIVLQLINDILDFSKVESGVMKLEATKFRPREVIKNILQTTAASLKKMLILEGHVADDVPVEVIGDVLRVQQILTNLISNAVKFTHEGKIKINLYVIADPCPKEQKEHEKNEPQSQSHEPVMWIRCDVQDTGIGIPETALPLLFKKYMQADADTARKFGGTGLGLAICKQLVELMGGHLTVTSKVNYGSTFTFVLPHKVPQAFESSDETDEYQDGDHDNASMEEDDVNCGFFQFKTQDLGSLFSSNVYGPTHELTRNEVSCDKLDRLGLPVETSSECNPENNNMNHMSLDQDRPFHNPCIQKNHPSKTNMMRVDSGTSTRKSSAILRYYDSRHLITINNLMMVRLPASLKLTSTNYLSWKTQIEALLHGLDLYRFIDGTNPAPAPTVAEDGSKQPHKDYAQWFRQDRLLFGALIGSLSPAIVPLITNAGSSQEAWKILANTYASPSRGHIKQLQQRLKQSTKTPNQTMTDYMQGVKSVVDEVAILGKKMDEEDVIDIILNGLDQAAYKPLLDVVHARDNPITFNELHEKLINHELTLSQQVVTQGFHQPATVFHVQDRSQHSSSPPSKPWSSRQEYQASGLLPTPPPDSNAHPFLGKCQWCHIQGHSLTNCDSFKKAHPHISVPSFNGNSQVKSAQVHTMNAQQPTTANWLFDSGASHHVTNDLNNLSDSTEELVISDGRTLENSSSPGNINTRDI